LDALPGQVVTLYTRHRDGGMVARSWVLPDDKAEQLADDLGEPDVEMLMPPELLAAAAENIPVMPYLTGDDDR
jgi:hypothetical protein